MSWKSRRNDFYNSLRWDQNVVATTSVTHCDEINKLLQRLLQRATTKKPVHCNELVFLWLYIIFIVTMWLFQRNINRWWHMAWILSFKPSGFWKYQRFGSVGKGKTAVGVRLQVVPPLIVHLSTGLRNIEKLNDIPLLTVFFRLQSCKSVASVSSVCSRMAILNIERIVL